jgi:hypothetical protein
VGPRGGLDDVQKRENKSHTSVGNRVPVLEPVAPRYTDGAVSSQSRFVRPSACMKQPQKRQT